MDMNQDLRRQLWLKWMWKLLLWSIEDKMFHLKSQITACSTELEFATGLFYLICCFEENVKQLADFKNIKII